MAPCSLGGCGLLAAEDEIPGNRHAHSWVVALIDIRRRSRGQPWCDFRLNGRAAGRGRYADKCTTARLLRQGETAGPVDDERHAARAGDALGKWVAELVGDCAAVRRGASNCAQRLGRLRPATITLSRCGGILGGTWFIRSGETQRIAAVATAGDLAQ